MDEPTKQETLNQKIKDIKRINEERPCKTCAYYVREKLIHCGKSTKLCDFYHSGYEPIEETRGNEELEETDY